MRERRIILFITCLILGLIASLVLVAYIRQTFSTLVLGAPEHHWNLDSIESSLGVSIPDNATNIQFSGENGRLVQLNLIFNAPPEAMSKFADHICEGILYPHYDPFNAIHTSNPIAYDYVVKLMTAYDSTDYSYSPNAQQTTYGNRCFGEKKNQIFYILVDKSNSSLYKLSLKYYTSCGPAPCVDNFLDIKPIPQLPILLRGFYLENKDDGKYYLATDKFCIEIDPVVFTVPNGEWNDLPDSEIQLQVDNQPLKPARISDRGLLMPEDSFLVGTDNLNDLFFSYCHWEDWQSGSHTLKINITVPSGKNYAYSWLFYAN